MTHTVAAVSLRAFQWLMILMVFGTTVGLYAGALDSPFTLDDLGNLAGLMQLPERPQLIELMNYVIRDNQPSRPIALGTFAIDFWFYGRDPWGYHLSNLVVHLLNGVLFVTLAYRLLRLTDDELPPRLFLIALLGTALWLVHPLNASTVLYVVQRMAQLGTLFVLVGLHVYLAARIAWYRGHRYGALATIAALPLFAVIGVFAKENAVLLPLLAGVLEITWLSRRFPLPTSASVWLYRAVLISPIVLIMMYGVFYLTSYLDYRPEFTLEQRLLSQGRVIWDYIGQMLLPRPWLMGLAHDDFRLSTDFFTPITTLPALVGITGLLALAALLRRHHPWISFAILWFFAAHGLESTLMPLELYFEHRNYLAMFGPMLTIAYYTVGRERQPLLPRALLGGAVCLLIVGMGVYNARLWADPPRLGEVWAEHHPDSLRAHQFAAQRWVEANRGDRALEYLDRLEALQPNNVCQSLARLHLHCRFSWFGVPQNVYDNAVDVARNGTACGSTITYIHNLTLRVVQQGCGILDRAHLIELMANLAENPRIGTANRAYAFDSIARCHGKTAAARLPLRQSIALEPTIDRYLWIAKAEALAGEADRAQQALTRAESMIGSDWLTRKARQADLRAAEENVRALLK